MDDAEKRRINGVARLLSGAAGLFGAILVSTFVGFEYGFRFGFMTAGVLLILDNWIGDIAHAMRNFGTGAGTL